MTQLNNDITEFFHYIYEIQREDIPGFMVTYHEFKMRHAASEEDIQTDAVYWQKLSALVGAYEQVLGTVSGMPDDLQPATLKVLSGSVVGFLEGVGADERTVTAVLGDLNRRLSHYEITSEQIDQVLAIIEQG